MEQTRQSARRGLARAAVLLFVAHASTAFADRRTVVHVEGSVPWTNAAVKADVAAALPGDLVSLPSPRFEAGIKKRPRGSLRRALLTSYGKLAMADEARLALTQADRDVAVVVDLDRNAKGKPLVRVLVVDSARHTPLLFRVEDLPRLKDHAAKVAWWKKLLEPSLEEREPERPAAPETTAATPALPDVKLEESPEPAEAVPEKQPEAPAPVHPPVKTDALPPPKHEPQPAGPRGFTWRAIAGFDMSYRRFSHDAEPPAAGRSYEAWPVPGFRVGAEAYPLGETFGLDVGYARSVGVHSTAFGGQIVETTWNRVEAAFKARWFTARHEHAPSVSALLGYEYSEFVFAATPPDREVPTAQYHLLRAGGEARLPIDRFTLLAGGEYHRMLSIGALGSVSAAGGGNGFALALGFRFEVLAWLLLAVDGRYARYVFALDRTLSKNTLDQYVTAGGGFEAVF